MRDNRYLKLKASGLSSLLQQVRREAGAAVNKGDLLIARGVLAAAIPKASLILPDSGVSLRITKSGI